MTRGEKNNVRKDEGPHDGVLQILRKLPLWPKLTVMYDTGGSDLLVFSQKITEDDIWLS